MNKKKAIFLDRDGVLINDSHLLTNIKDIEILAGVAEALKTFKDAGYKLLVVTNQTVVSRGLATIEDVGLINQYINDNLSGMIDEFYICPHHPNADIEDFKVECECRKPLPGMLLAGASEYDIDLSKSWMIGDRISDIIAGQNVGCKTILVETGAHEQKPIISKAMPQDLPEPDFICEGLLAASEIILSGDEIS